jgi:hypothetical protein
MREVAVDMRRRTKFFALPFLFFSLLMPIGTVMAATTGTGPANLITIQGSAAQCRWGDAYSAANNTGCVGGATGLNTYYSYWVEVPPGTAQLELDIFDADIGANGVAGNHDTSRGGAYNTSVQYTLRDPAGIIPAGFNATLGAGACAGCDNAWATWGASPVINPTPGYWEFRVDQSSAVTLGDDVNRVGVRAYDPSSNLSLNVFYYVSNMGPSTSGSSQSTLNYPYVTSGCFVGNQNFDFDSTGSISLTTRLGNALPAFPVSGNGDWRNGTQVFESSDDSAEDYGIWNADLTLTGSNFGGWFFYPEVGGSAAPPVNRFALNDGRATRTYLGVGTTAAPTGAPVKPYLAQWVRQHGAGSPEFTVTVRLMNPTAYSITGAVVEGEIPAPVTYDGVRMGFPTHGSMSTAPALGASGSYSWMIGAVAPGASAVMAYNISVPDPAVVTTVTGPANSVTATQAKFNDETTTAFATGGLCELRIGPGLTQAVVSDFSAEVDSSKTIVRWVTASEVGTLGFYLERKVTGADKWVRLNNSQLILGLGLSHPQGGQYLYIDTETAGLQKFRYRLVEVEVKGNERIYGPYETIEGNAEAVGVEGLGGDVSYSVTPRLHAATKNNRVASAPLGNVQILNPHGMRIGIRETGLYYIGSGTIATKLNLPKNAVANSIADGRLRLTIMGEALDWLPADGDAGLYFYAEAIDSNYTRDNVVLLEQQPGRTMESEDGGLPLLSNTADIYKSSQHFEKDVIPVLVRSVKDYWLWGWVANFTSGTNNYNQANFDFELHDVVNGNAELLLALEGYSETQHLVTVKVNGLSLGTIHWDGQTSLRPKMSIPPGVLLEGNNTLTLIHENVSDGTSFVYLNNFDIQFPSYTVAQNDMLDFDVAENTMYTVSGFVNGLIRLLRIDNPLRPVVVGNATVKAVGNTYQVSFLTGGTGKYLAVSDGAVKSPAWTEGYFSSSLYTPQNQADYLVIAPDSLLSGAQALADYRAASGLITRVVTLKEIYLAFNHGIEDPIAIRHFIRYAYEHWQVAPRYLVLAGDSSYDHRHVLSDIRDDHIVPAIFAGTPDGLFAADNLYGAIQNDAPRVAVGRIPARDNAALLGYVMKLQTWEALFATDRTVQLVADNADIGVGDFPADSENVLKLEIPPSLLAAQDIYLDPVNPNIAHDDFLASLNAGKGLVNYLGHGGMDRLGHEGILTSLDVPQLSNTQTPVMTALSCVVNRHEVAGVDNLGEQLVMNPGAGAVAMWAPTGLSQNNSAVELNRKLLHAVYTAGHTVLGDAIVDALQSYAAVSSVKYMPKIYTLLGDPVVRIRPGAAKSSRITNAVLSDPDDLAGGQAGVGGAVGCVGRQIRLQSDVFVQDTECAASSRLEAENTEVEVGASVRFCAPLIELKAGFRVRGGFSAGPKACVMALK